jgi:hypothetical protein
MIGSFKILVGALAAAATFAANAQPAPGKGGMTAPTKAAPATNCAKARDPQRCEALQRAKEICKDKNAVDKRKCMSDAMPPMDCSKSRSPARCEAHQKAKVACKDKSGSEHRQCMREQTRASGKSGDQPATPKKK